MATSLMWRMNGVLAVVVHMCVCTYTVSLNIRVCVSVSLCDFSSKVKFKGEGLKWI